MLAEIPFRRLYFSESVMRAAGPPGHLSESLASLPPVVGEETDHDLVVALGSELLWHRDSLPEWIGSETRYLIIVDVPEPAILRIPTVLGVHKPDLRIHCSRDADAIVRLLLAFHRDRVWEGIVDAYSLGTCLIVVLGDMSMREFPQERLPDVADLSEEKFAEFSIDPSGSFLHWPAGDVHLGPSQMLQAVDPMHLADVEIERYALQKMSLVLRDMREERGLRQGDIPDLSERHVRRLEKEELRLTVDAAQKYARAFEQDLAEFLDQLSSRISLLATSEAGESVGEGSSAAATSDNARYRARADAPRDAANR